MRTQLALRFLSLLPALTLPTLLLCSPAHADSYTVYDVANSSGSVINVGLTTSGTFVVYFIGNSTYGTFTPPSTLTTSSTAPTLTYDDGVSCTPTGTGAYTSVGAGVCNNGREVFTASADGVHTYLYNGPDPTADLVYMSSSGDFFLNSVGDIALVSLINANPQLDDSNILLIDQTTRMTPEPNSLALLATGAASIAGLLRLRRKAER